MLSQLREQLGAARKHSAALLAARAELFAAYKLNVRPALQRRRAKLAAAAETAGSDRANDTEESDEPSARATPAASRTRARLVLTSTAARTTEKRSVKTTRGAPGARRAASRGRKRPPARG